MESKNLRPLSDRVLVRPDKPDSKTASGIIIPDTAKDKATTGEVVAVGIKCTDELKVGDRVLYSKFAGMAMEGTEEEILVMRESDIFTLI